MVQGEQALFYPPKQDSAVRVRRTISTSPLAWRRGAATVLGSRSCGPGTRATAEPHRVPAER